LRGLPTRLQTAPAETAAVAAIIRRTIAEG